MTDLTTREFDRILLIKPSALGDVIHTLPVLHGLRVRYPRAHISWLVNRGYAALLDGHPELDEVIPFDRGAFGGLRRLPGGIAGLPSLVRGLRRRRFDLAIDLQGLFRSGLMTWATGAPIKLGLQPAREGAGLFYNHRIEAPNDGRHAVERNYCAAETLGFAHVPIQFRLPVQGDAREQLAVCGHAAGFDPHTPYILVAPSSRWETKNWLPERFVATLDGLANDGRQVVLCGSPADDALCARIADACRSRPVNLAGRTALPVLVALIDGADVVLCNDSATAHLAVALGRPLLTLFGPTDPRRTGPYGRPDSVLQADIACSPCFIRRVRSCPHGLECMKRITVEQVRDRLNRTPGGN